MRTSGSARAASAWKYCALPISPPPLSAGPTPATTRALLLMFCALKGATRSPWRAYQRHSAVVSQLLPAPLVVPSTITQRAGRPVDESFIAALSESRKAATARAMVRDNSRRAASTAAHPPPAPDPMAEQLPVTPWLLSIQ